MLNVTGVTPDTPTAMHWAVSFLTGDPTTGVVSTAVEGVFISPVSLPISALAGGGGSGKSVVVVAGMSVGGCVSGVGEIRFVRSCLTSILSMLAEFEQIAVERLGVERATMRTGVMSGLTLVLRPKRGIFVLDLSG